MNFWCFSLPQRHPRFRCLCFRSFNFDIFRSNHSSISHIMPVYGHHFKEHTQRSPN